MRKMKKVVSILLAMVMVMAMGITAFATNVSGSADTTYTITITSEKSGHTYEAYQVFTGTLYEAYAEYTGTAAPADGTQLYTYDDTTGEYSEATYDAFSGVTYYTYEKSVLSDIEWGSGVKSSDLITALKEASSTSSNALYGLFPSKDSDNNDIAYTAADIAEILSENNTSAAIAEAFAQLVSENLTSTVAGASTETVSPYTIEDLSAGYYLVKDKDDSVTADGDAYTDIILQVVSDVEVEAKAEYPTVTKTVSEGDEDAGIGDTVTFTLTGYVPDTSAYDSYTYIFNDTLSKGLTINSTDTGSGTEYDLTVTVYSKADVESGFTTGTDYYTLSSGTFEKVDTNTVTTPETGTVYYIAQDLVLGTTTTSGNVTTTTGDYLLTVASGQDDTTSITVEILNAKDYSEDYIVVSYDATLNSDATIGGDGNSNAVYVTYSNDPNWDGDGDEPTGNTPKEEVVVFTFELDVTKVDGDDASITLQGAEFVLYKIVDNTTYYVVVDDDNKVTGWTTYLSAQDNDPLGTVYASTLTSDANGDFSITGLDVGTYYLKETKAPDGYNTLSSPVTIVISATYEDTDNDGVDEIKTLTATADGKDLTTNVTDGTVSASIENNSGAVLPGTGGIGTTIFYIIGAILVLGAAVLLITRRRMRA